MPPAFTTLPRALPPDAMSWMPPLLTVAPLAKPPS